jgi:hypothetical protein
LKPAVEEVSNFPQEYDCDADDTSAKTEMLKGEFKMDRNSEFGKDPTSRDISRKYDPAAVARKKEEYNPGLSFLTIKGGGVCPETKFCKTRYMLKVESEVLILLLNKSRTSIMNVVKAFATDPLKAAPETMVVAGSG